MVILSLMKHMYVSMYVFLSVCTVVGGGGGVWGKPLYLLVRSDGWNWFCICTFDFKQIKDSQPYIYVTTKQNCIVIFMNKTGMFLHSAEDFSKIISERLYLGHSFFPFLNFCAGL